MQISGHAAIVTGAASGLGEAIARQLARLGAKVAVLDVNTALARATAAHGSARILMIRLDGALRMAPR